MFEIPFAHGIIKQIVIGFGSLFSEIKIIRKDNNGVVQQTINVPLAYAPKEHWVTRTEQDPNLEGSVFTTLPRMSFEVTGYNYDTARMVNRNNQIKYSNGNNSATVHAPVPYNLDISLYVLTKGTEDALCIVEQILPLFAPEYTLNFTAIPDISVKQEVPIILNSVSVQDDYEGDFQTRRLVTHTFNFTAKANLYAGVHTGSVILSTKVDLDTQTLGAGENVHRSAGVLATKTITQDIWTP
jgi:hypothetical protein